jgi:hypothetical protein
MPALTDPYKPCQMWECEKYCIVLYFTNEYASHLFAWLYSFKFRTQFLVSYTFCKERQRITKTLTVLQLRYCYLRNLIWSKPAYLEHAKPEL